MGQPVLHTSPTTTSGTSRHLAGVMSILACVVGISLGRVVGPRAAHAEQAAIEPVRLVGSLAGLHERVDMIVTPDAVLYRVVDVRTGVVLAEGLSVQQLAARYPHLDPAGDVAAPVLMLADDGDVPIGW